MVSAVDRTAISKADQAPDAVMADSPEARLAAPEARIAQLQQQNNQAGAAELAQLQGHAFVPTIPAGVGFVRNSGAGNFVSSSYAPRWA